MTYKPARETSFTIVGIAANNSLKSGDARPAAYLYMTKPAIAAEPWQQLRIQTGPIDMNGLESVAMTLQVDDENLPLSVNHELLETYPGVMSGPKVLIYSFATVLIIIVGLAGIGLIQNAFLISFTKRASELSLLSSIGMTTKQRMTLSLLEGLFLFMVALPLGFALAVLAMTILTFVLNPILQRMMGTAAWLTLAIDWQSLLLIALSGLILIFVASILPVLRSRHVSPLAGIRRQTDIRMPARKLKAPRWLKRIGGKESEIAWKNMKRNKRPFRATLVALVFSLVLYLSLASLIQFAESTVGFVETGLRPDIHIRSGDQAMIDREDDVLALLKSGENYTRRQIVYSSTINLRDSEGVLTPEAAARYDDRELTMLASTDDLTMRDILNEIGRKEPLEPGEVILVNAVPWYDKNQVRWFTLYETPPDVLKNVLFADDAERIDLKVVEMVERPLETYSVWMMPYVIGSKATLSEIGGFQTEVYLNVSDDNYQQLIYDLRNEARNMNLDLSIDDSGRYDRQTRDLLLLARIILFGFATVIALIGLSNLYNSLISSLQYRKGEFAMLRAVGMGNESMNKMIRVESLFYGVKLLLYGIPLAILSSYLILRYLNRNVSVLYTIPILHYLIASAIVLLLIYLMMWSGSKKARKNVIAEELKYRSEV